MSRAALRSTLALTGVGGLFATALLNAAVAGAAEACVTGEDGATTVCTLVDTGAEQAFVVPEGVRALEVTIPGGEQPAPAQLAIAPGSTLLVDLGGAGEFRLPPEPAEEGAAEDVPVPQWVIDSDTGVSALLRVAPEVEDPAPVGEAAEILADDAAVLPSDGVVAAGSVEDEAADPVELPPASIVIRYSVPQPAATPAPTAPAPAQTPVDDSSEVPAVAVPAAEVPVVEVPAAEAAPAEMTPAEIPPAPEEAPVEVPLIEPTPTETEPVTAPPAEPTPTEPTAGPAEAPVEEAPVEEAPVEVAPVEVAPVEVAPIEVAAASVEPVEATLLEAVPASSEVPTEVAPAALAVPVEVAPVEAPVTTAPVVRGTAEPTDVPTPASNPARTAETPAPAAEAPVALDLQAASSALPDDLLDTNGVGMLAAALAGVVTVGVVVLLAGGARRRD